MDGTPIIFAGAATASVAIASTMSKASMIYNIAMVGAGALATYASYRFVIKKKRRQSYLMAVLAIVVALVALNYYSKLDRSHFADLVRKIN